MTHKHAVEMSPQEQQQAIDAARELALQFDKIGATVDDENRFPTELVPLYKDSGLVGIAVPKEYGGGGADIWTLSQISRELAKGDPACSLSFNMHQTMVGIFRGLIPDEAKAVWFPKIAAEKQIVCGPFSEDRAGLMGLADTTATPTPDGGYLINGKKTWSTLCQGADVISFNASVTDPEGHVPEEHMQRVGAEDVFIMSMDNPGISIKETWDAMGMRATGTHTVVFENAKAPGSANSGNFRMGLFDQFEWAAMTFSGVYLGLLEKALANSVEILKTKSLGATLESDNQTLKSLGFVPYGVGQMRVAQQVSARLLEMTCRMLIDQRDAGMDTYSRVAWLDVVKVTITESAFKVADDGMRLVGGSSFRRGHVLERMHRDARSGPFHPLTTDQTYDLLGRIELGLMGQPPETEEAAGNGNGAAARDGVKVTA